MLSDPYAPHRRLAATARPGASPGRLVLGAFLVVLAFVAVPDVAALLGLSESQIAEFQGGTTAPGMLAQLCGYLVPLAMLRGVMRRLHGLPLRSLFGPPELAWRQGVAVALMVFAVLAAQDLLPPWPLLGNIAAIRPVGEWLMWLVPGLVLLLVQTGAEEAFFRGYLQQQLAALSDRPLIWMGLPSLIFGIVHYWNAPGPVEGVLWAVWAGLLGLACADLAARGGTLGPAIGLHFANNVASTIVFGGLGAPGSGLALILLNVAPPAMASRSVAEVFTPAALLGLVFIALGNLVVWLAGRIALRR